MPANTAIIGRVAVKVLPDTTDFRRDAQRKLDAIEHQLELVVPTKIDMSGASREFLEELRKINARNRASDSRKIRFGTIISTDGMRDAIVAARRKLQVLADQKKIEFRADLSNVQASPINVQLDLDPQSLRDVKQKMDHWVRDNSPLKIPVHLEWTTSSAELIRARLSALTRPRRVPIIPDLDGSATARVSAALAALSGARVIGEIGEDFSRFIKNLDKSVPRIAGMALAVGGLAASVLASGSNVLAFGASLASIAPAALALPGILGGMAVGVGITVAAFRDFNKELPGVKGQLSTLQDIISKNFWEKFKAPMQSMVDTLFPLLKQHLVGTSSALGGFFAGMATGVKDMLANKLGSMFADLDSSIRIATGGTGAFVGIITTLGQTGAGYLPRLAQWFVNISTQFNNFLTKAASDGSLQRWIDTGITALKDLGRILVDLGSVLGSLAKAAVAAGGSTFGIMADTLDRIAKAAQTPAFQHGLTDVLMSAHKAFELIGKSGPAVGDFFTAFGALLANVLPTIGATIGTLLTSVMSALSDPSVSQGIVSMFQGIQTGVTALAPAFAALGPVIGSLAALIGTFAAAFGPVVTSAIVAVGPAFTNIANSLKPLIDMLSGALTSALTSLGPHITNLSEGLSKLFSGGLTEAMGNIVHTLLPPLTAGFGALMDVVGSLSGKLSEHSGILTGVLAVALTTITVSLGTTAVAWVTTTAVAVASSMLQAAKIVFLGVQWVIYGAIVAVQSAIVVAKWIWQAAVAVAQGAVMVAQFVIQIAQWVAMGVAAAVNAAIVVAGWVATAAGAVAAGVVYLVQGAIIIGQWIAMGIAALAGAAQVAIAWLIAMGPIALVVAAVIALVVVIVMNFGKIKEFIGAAWEWVKAKTVALWNAIKDAISSAASAIWSFIVDKFNAIKNFISQVWDAVRSAASSAWNAIRSAVSSGIDAVSNAVSSGLNAVKNFFVGVWNSLTGIVSSAWGAIRGAVSGGIDGMMGLVRGIPGMVSGALGNLGGLLLGAGRSIIDGLVHGIESGIDKVKGILNSVTNLIPSWKGPLPLDKVLLKGAGIAIMGGFVNGLESQYDAVRDSLRGLTDDLADMVSMPDVNMGLNGTAKINGIANGAYDTSRTDSPKVFNYYAAPGSSLGSEEELFAASNRARMVGW